MLTNRMDEITSELNILKKKWTSSNQFKNNRKLKQKVGSLVEELREIVEISEIRVE